MGTIVAVVGARPNFMKIAPVMAALDRAGLSAHLVHTGQHYDESMKASFFRQLDIPEPDVDLEVGSGTHAVQTGEILIRFEPVLERFDASAVLVVGDVNSTVACALVAAKRHIPVIHVEAGLRSFDRSMPEEVNRVLTDQISDVLFTTERSARENLLREGIRDDRIHFVGNVMIDSLMRHEAVATEPAETLARHGAPRDAVESAYAVLTLHRPSNVDSPDVLEALFHTLDDVSRRLPVVFPVHPRTSARLEALGLTPRDRSRFVHLPPVGYLEMLGLMRHAKLVLTDSGGMQEETTAFGVPCLTLRENTERPITVSEGTNTVVGQSPERIREEVERVLATGGKAGRRPELWDGRAAERIGGVLATWLAGGAAASALVERGDGV